jgi:hypothetical protein
MGTPNARLGSRAQYLAALDTFLVDLAGDSQMGVILGFEDRHGERLNRLLRDRAALDGPSEGSAIRDRRVVDALEDVAGAIGRLREAIKGPR